MKRRTSLTLATLLSAIAGAVAVSTACGPSGFTSSSVIDSVRILATRADNDKSYARPGDVVTLEALTVDGRTNKTPPAVLYWIPYVCENPFDDAYYGCFAPLLADDAGTGGSGGQLPSPDAGTSNASDDAGAPGGSAGDDAGDDAAAPAPTPTPSPVIPPSALGALFTAGTDITPYLPTGPFTFKVPADAITTHAPVSGEQAPYGIVIIFNIACAGRVRTLPINPAAGPQQVPIACFDDQGNLLGPDQYVIGFTRVYVSETQTNLNPVIDGFVFNGVEAFAADAGSGIPSPVGVTVPADGGFSGGVPIDTDVPVSSWAPQHKSIWVDYYATNEGLGDDAHLLYDVNAGRSTFPDAVNAVTYTPPDDAGPTTLWAVVHDSNDGVNWLQVNVTTK